ncbi:hypothetical protein IZ6_24610 [Terrihabitans soli]|uniref:Uncharacterized protein n=1 Tax=Terrihabitans soli TaxID=708113 RepID=A0A6S6QQB6_9HYPH|nr:hypothetical protein [Terrihabitans soli]BCJ91726.1 hypothetical protein IZ6_24610 [Terrihabitans soli]
MYWFLYGVGLVVVSVAIVQALWGRTTFIVNGDEIVFTGLFYKGE